MPDTLTVVAFGDSTTAPREGVTVYVELLQRHWHAVNRKVRVINAGVRGDNTDGALARLTFDVLAHAPHVVILRFGINDAAIDVWATPPAREPRVPLPKFRRNIEELVARIREIGALPILCTPNPLAWHEITLPLYGRKPYLPDDADGFNVVLRDYVAELHALAAALAIPVVDMDAAFRQHTSDESPPWAALLLDGMHPNDAGHQLAAARLAPAIDKLLAEVA